MLSAKGSEFHRGKLLSSPTLEQLKSSPYGNTASVFGFSRELSQAHLPSSACSPTSTFLPTRSAPYTNTMAVQRIAERGKHRRRQFLIILNPNARDPANG
jgi:hypothetical protein